MKLFVEIDDNDKIYVYLNCADDVNGYLGTQPPKV